MRNLRRSFDVYYRDAKRTGRMDTLNAHFVRPGALAFDVGAHVGDRTASFLRLGARVVAVEPQPRVFRALRLIHGRTPQATLIQSAIGAAPGTATLYVNSANPTVSTASSALVEAAPDAPAWQDQSWDHHITVPVTTLDALIDTHGLPDFVKLDVEGFELEALHGLSKPLPALSFEITMLQRDIGLACLDRLDALGPYQFNFSLGEDHKLLPTWIGFDTMKAYLHALPDTANSGDVFARLLS